MAVTIAEISVECGVSEQAIRAWCRRNHVAKDAKGSFAITEVQKTAIYQHYLGAVSYTHLRAHETVGSEMCIRDR